ncbi:MAG: hypothetical protein H6818_08010 [Phycisphaerales bacterium]|nr:hypothetical protein [Phycisphaerales bacterium]MCB9862517.1 hypothetical protein [Phycisphaerales bacterium]
MRQLNPRQLQFSQSFGQSACIAILFVVALEASAGEGWSFEPSPNAGSFINTLTGVDATSPQNVWAVGSSSNSILDRLDTLVMRWDGTTWTIFNAPNPNTMLQTNQLYDVSTIGLNDAWAVGRKTFGPNNEPFLIHWNGTNWAEDSSSADLPVSYATAVHMQASDDVWALGVITQGGQGYPALVAHYDGSSWTPIAIDNMGFGGIQFEAVHGVASDDIWAGGFNNPGLGIFMSIASHWDGSEWNTMALPQAEFGCEVHDIAMVATDDVWAVGQCMTTSIGDQPYAVHWDGSSWTAATLPVLPDGHGRLEGVAARASNDIWAAGTDGDADGNPRPLLMHYDGFSWQTVSAPATGGSGEWFHGACVAGDEVFAVGNYFSLISSTLSIRLHQATSGDIDDDGDVDLDDASALVAVLLGSPMDPAHVARSDLNGDGQRNGLDVAAFLGAILE